MLPRNMRQCVTAFACFLITSHAFRADEGQHLPRGLSANMQAVSASAPPAEAFRVLAHPQDEGPEITPYLSYQISLAWRHDELRRSRWSQVKSQADLLALRLELRRSLSEMIGKLPAQKTDLHAIITGTIAAKGFHIEKLIYQSIPGLYVTALLYIPDDGAKMHPAVLVAAGHSPKGKNYYQELCQRFVKRGYFVLSWDPVGQGERSQFWDTKAKKSRYNLICGEHAVMGNLAYLAGTNLARWEIWDGMRAVDYLLSRRDVDGKRINLTGTSGGGFQAALLGAIDERIHVVIPSCYITSLPMRIANRIFVDPDSDPEQDLFGFVSKHVDHAGLLLMMYPRAVMISAATLDYFPVQGTEKSYSEVRAFYERFGYADRIGLVESYNPHQFSLKNQEAALDFLDRFNAMPLRHSLPPVTNFEDSDLQVTMSGQVSVDFPDAKSLPYYIAQYAADNALRLRSSLTQMYRTEQDPEISSWAVSQFTGSAPSGGLQWQHIGGSLFAGIHIDRYLLHHSTYLEMPLLRFFGEEGHPKGAIVWVSFDGKATEKDWVQIARLVNEGYEVYSLDFRGMGETRMHFRTRSSDAPELSQGDSEQAYDNALSGVLAGYIYNSLLTGRPYFLQLLDDLKIAELFIQHQTRQSRIPAQSITLTAAEDAYCVASRFQEIDRRVKLLSVKPPITCDWSALVRKGQEQWPIAFLVPSGALIP